MDQDETWHRGRPQPQPHCVRWGPHSAGHSAINFGPCIVAKIGGAVYCALPMYCGQRAGWIKMPLRREVDLGTGDIVSDGDSAPPKKRGNSTPQYWPMYCGQTA